MARTRTKNRGTGATRARQIKRLGIAADPFARFRDGSTIALAENPNRSKRHASPATARHESLTAGERERIRDARRDYRPLTVRTRIDRDRIGRKLPASRVSETQGYTV